MNSGNFFSFPPLIDQGGDKVNPRLNGEDKTQPELFSQTKIG